jgi:HEAT repeat protein
MDRVDKWIALYNKADPTGKLRLLRTILSLTDHRLTPILLDFLHNWDAILERDDGYHYGHYNGYRYYRNFVKAVERSGDPALTDALIELAKHENASLRRHIYELLGYVKDKRVLKPLLNGLSDRETILRFVALNSLRINPTLNEKTIKGIKKKRRFLILPPVNSSEEHNVRWALTLK